MTSPDYTFRGKTVEPIGEMISDEAYLGDVEALRERLTEKGYLYFKGFHPTEEVLDVRFDVLKHLAEEGCLKPGTPIEEAAYDGRDSYLFETHFEALHELLYGERMAGFFRQLLGAPERHFDFTWLRAVPPGYVTDPHCDVVYMGRGTFDLLTCWTPLDTLEPGGKGGLMILEDSHLKGDALASYLSVDVDAYCENKADAEEKAQTDTMLQNGALSRHPNNLARKLGGRWLSASFEPGDIVVFGMGLVHASLDNSTEQFRLSVDCRFQRASEPVDNRWVGENPPAHGVGGKRGMIC